MEKKEGQETRIAWWQPALLMFARLSVWIVVPVLLATFLGKWLDDKNNSEPLVLISTVGFAFFVSMFGLVKEAKKEYDRIEKENKK